MSAAGRLGRSGAKQIHIRSTRCRSRVEPGSFTGRRRPRVDRWPPIDPVDPGSTPDSLARRSTQVRSTQNGSTQATRGRPLVDPVSIADWPGVDPWSTADRSGRPDVVPEPTRCQNLIQGDRRSTADRPGRCKGRPLLDSRSTRSIRGRYGSMPGSTGFVEGRSGVDPRAIRSTGGLTKWPTRRPEIDCGSTPGRSGIDRPSTLDHMRYDCGSSDDPLADGDRPVAAGAVDAASMTRGDPESTDGRVGIDHE